MNERENKIITDKDYSSAQYRQILRISQMTMDCIRIYYSSDFYSVASMHRI